MRLLLCLLPLCATQVPQESYDFVVVGAGLGGAVVASKLSAFSDNSVLLVEAGDYPVFPESVHLADFFDAWANPNIAHNFNSTPQPGLDNQIQNLRRGAVGGGCTQVNAGVWFLGDRRLFDLWESLGNPGWSYADMRPYLLTANEAFSGRVNQGMADGEDFMTLLKTAGAQQSYKWLPDPNLANASAFGMSPRYLSAWLPPNAPPNTKAFRATSWGQFLTPDVLARPNLDILTWSQVTSVNFNEGSPVTARGVHIRHRQTNREYDIKAAKEVILCAGAFDTPKILQLSGIGNATSLKSVGVSPVVDLPGVGQNLQDHLYLPLVSPPFLNQSIRIPFDAYGQTGVIAYPDMGPNITNYYLAAMPLVDEASQLKAMEVDSETFLFVGRGTVSISSPSFDSPLIIDPQYLMLPEDQQHALRAFKAARALMYSPALMPLYNSSADELAPGFKVKTDDEILNYIRTGSHSDYHYAGTCKMGADTDAMAVVNGELLVRGVHQLRIVDGSVLPVLPPGNPQLHTYMVSLKAVELIKQTHKLR